MTPQFEFGSQGPPLATVDELGCRTNMTYDATPMAPAASGMGTPSFCYDGLQSNLAALRDLIAGTASAPAVAPEEADEPIIVPFPGRGSA
jgi:hypothetical protein